MIVAIVQARMASTRLPDKVLVDIANIMEIEYEQVLGYVKGFVDNNLIVCSPLSPDYFRNNLDRFSATKDKMAARNNLEPIDVHNPNLLTGHQIAHDTSNDCPSHIANTDDAQSKFCIQSFICSYAGYVNESMHT